MIRYLNFFITTSLLLSVFYAEAQKPEKNTSKLTRQRISINRDWQFKRFENAPDTLIYDERPLSFDRSDNKVADTRATESGIVATSARALKKWILPTANNFIKNPNQHYQRPADNPGKDYPFVKSNFDDSNWESVQLPHDWAAKEPFYKGDPVAVGGGMGRLPIQGVGWYRRKINIDTSDIRKSIFLDIDGAMSYAMVWCNGYLVGG